MDVNLIVGLGVLAGTLSLMVTLVLWGRRIIARIASRGFASAREITRDATRGR